MSGHSRRRRSWAILDACLVILAAGIIGQKTLIWAQVHWAPVPPLVTRGVRLELPGTESQTGIRHVIVRISTSCPVSAAVGPVLAALAAAQGPEVDVTVVSSEADGDMTRWLANTNVRDVRVVRVDHPSDLGFIVVPTIVITDRRQVVTDLLLGRPTDTDAAHLLRRVAGTESEPIDNSNYASESTEPVPLLRQSLPVPAMVLDIGSRASFAREHASELVNIPEDELPVRAAKELSGAGAIIIPCHRSKAVDCRAGARYLVAGTLNRAVVIAWR